MMHYVKLLLVVALALSSLTKVAHAQGQSPTPIVVQAASTANTATRSREPDSLQAAMKLLEQMKAANAEMLKKQHAALEQLDELQKAAEQIKIYAHRG